MQLVMFRWLGVIAILLVFTRKHLVRDWPILRQHLLFLTIIGSLGFTLFNYLFYLAGHHTSALNIGFLQGSIPVFVLLCSWLVLRKGVTPVQAIGILITLVGGHDYCFRRQLGVNCKDLSINRVIYTL